MQDGAITESRRERLGHVESGRGMSLPFHPLILAFNHMYYSVDMPSVSPPAPCMTLLIFSDLQKAQYPAIFHRHALMSGRTACSTWSRAVADCSARLWDACTPQSLCPGLLTHHVDSTVLVECTAKIAQDRAYLLTGAPRGGREGGGCVQAAADSAL